MTAIAGGDEWCDSLVLRISADPGMDGELERGKTVTTLEPSDLIEMISRGDIEERTIASILASHGGGGGP